MDNVLKLYKLDENGVKQPFPDAENNVISTFTYSAKRMGGAPTISCTFKYPTCLDNYWNENVIVEFRKETFFVRKTPTSSYSNTEALYSHEVTLVSERIILENVYFFDVVSDNNGDYQPVTNSTNVPFFGTIYEFTKRLNYSLRYSGLQTVGEDGTIEGYRVIVDPLEQGTDTTLYEKGYLITAQDQFFANVLQESYNTYKIPYYFDGKEIHIGFGFLDEVITEANNEPFEYGIDHSLLSIKKQNSNNKIVNRITGVGSADNIPHYYPNPTSAGTLVAVFSGEISSEDVTVVDQKKLLSLVGVDNKVEYFYTEKQGNFDASVYYLNKENSYVKAGEYKDNKIKWNISYYDSEQKTIIATDPDDDNHIEFTCKFNCRIALTSTVVGRCVLRVLFVFHDDAIYPKSSAPDVYLIDNDNDEIKKTLFPQVGGGSEGKLKNQKEFDIDFGILKEGETRKIQVEWTTTFTKNESFWFDPATKPFNIYAGLKETVTGTQYGWVGDNYKTSNIEDFGVILKEEVKADIKNNPTKYLGTSFKVVQDKYIQPQPNLTPSIYRGSEGKERFYNAINYPFLYEGEYSRIDGEYLEKVNKEGEPTELEYVHNDHYKQDDKKYIKFTKPYIEGHPSEHIENFEDIKPSIKGMTSDEGHPFDQFLDIEFDDYDNDEQDENGKYIHPYFFAKLPKYDFNLFEHAIDEGEMSISMTSGHCGACEFVIVVDEEKKVNKVWVNKDGKLERDQYGNVVCGRKVYYNGKEETQNTKIQDEQNDTKNNEVWVALRKDFNTFGTLYPKKGSIEPEKRKDTFVILHIDMPQQYIEAAEKRLDDALMKYMLENNEEKFSFSMNMSRIYLAEHKGIRDNINENSKVKIKYNGSEHILYISSYTYKASGKDALPEITVELKDAVTIQKNAVENAVGQVKTDLLSTLNPQNIALQVMQYFIRKDVNDIAKGRITFQQGLTSLGRAIFGDSIQSENYVGGLDVGRGWSIDNNGNAEFESLRVRSLLEVVELVINRLQAQEGDMLFTDNDQIDYVSVYTSGEETSYILTLKEKYEGYIHTQAYGNILKGTINTLAAQHAGVTDDFLLKNDYSDVAPAELESDIAGNTYYTSWMRVVGTYKTEPTVCDVNQIRVVLYGDGDTPANKNFIPCELMTIARWGCIDYSEEVEVLDNLKKEEGLGDNVKPEDAKATISKSIERRQRLFSISNSDGRIVKLRKVNQPKLEKHNYGTTIGILPDFVQEYSCLDGRLEETKDYLYARGIVVSDIIKITPTGDPIINYVDCGEWVDGSKVSEPSEPKLGKGKYLYNAYNADTAQWETHDVWHYGLKWRCLQSQPVNKTYYEPTWDSAYWQPIEGDMSLTMEFTSSNGYSFRRSAAWETEIKPHIFFGGIEITNYTQKVKILRWERTHEKEEGNSPILDEAWNSSHKDMKELHLTQDDMSIYWSSSNKMIFTCYAQVEDGSNTVIVENQIIA